MQRSLSKADITQLEQQGITAHEAQRQLDLLAGDKGFLTLDRPAVLGDGIQSTPAPASNARRVAAVRSGRWLKFVPASGAASRMFALKNDEQRRELCERIEAFAFFDDLRAACEQAGEPISWPLQHDERKQVIRRLLNTPGLGYAALPKGLLPFHRVGDSSRTPFEEHLREAARNFHSGEGRCAVHLTVSPEHRSLFEKLLAELDGPLGEDLDVKFDVGFSLQKPSTDTLALDAEGGPLRDDEGRLVLRPGGHGALIDNLNDLHADLVFVKNVDNVLHERLQGPTDDCIQALGGCLVDTQHEIFEHLEFLDGNPAESRIEEAERFLAAKFPGLAGVIQQPHGDRRTRIRELLHRPLRVCGMVRNEGEPGGGPFWVQEPDGSTSLQIVESAEVDPDDAAQQDIFRHSTHFNPVFMALALRDHHGEPYDLQQSINPDRVILTRKVSHGRSVRVLERPGLWNGAMANWNTVFVEVPKDVFAPVKTVFDLLRDAHQPRDAD